MPVWLETVDVSEVFRDEDLDLEPKRDAIVAKLRESLWYTLGEEGSWLHRAVDELAQVDSLNYFNVVWHVIYDLADRDRVWIKTF